MPKPIRLTFLIVIFSILVASCQPGVGGFFPLGRDDLQPVDDLETPTAAAISSTPSPVPTKTAAPTVTPTSTITPTITPTPIPIISLVFTGIIVPARCVQAAIDERGDPDFIYDHVRDIISGADLAIGTLNATLSDFPPRTGCVPTFLLVGGEDNADAMARAGFDAMSVATNHIKNCGISNCGDRAFLDTLHNLRRVGIEPVGAGKNHAEAMQPVVLTAHGVRFGIVSLGQIEPMAFASDTEPGIAVLTDENLNASIAAAREISDVVIAMPHWGPEYSPVPNYSQLHFAQAAVEAGADLVVGNHTHVVQAVEAIDGIDVFYGLGNFIFDQDWSRETQQGVILQVTFEGTRYLGYELIPTRVDGSGLVKVADEAEAAEIMERIEAAGRKIWR